MCWIAYRACGYEVERPYSYTDMRVSGYEIDSNRACGFVVSGGLVPNSQLLFSHPMPLSIGYWFYSSVDASCHRVLGIGFFGFVVSFNPMLLGAKTSEFALLDKEASAQRKLTPSARASGRKKRKARPYR